MFLITYHAKPNTTFEDYDEVGGAYINCWIEEKSSKDAKLIAEQEITDYDWSIESIEEILEVNEDFYSDIDPKREYFEQAMIDKVVLLFNTYPRE